MRCSRGAVSRSRTAQLYFMSWSSWQVLSHCATSCMALILALLSGVWPPAISAVMWSCFWTTCTQNVKQSRYCAANACKSLPYRDSSAAWAWCSLGSGRSDAVGTACRRG
eukprot:8558772-Pyramimonas_sp.AAC.1